MLLRIPHSRVCSERLGKHLYADGRRRKAVLVQEIYIIEENQGATSSKCVAKKGSTRALSNPPRYSNEMFYQKESSTHHTRPRFAGAWVGARSSLREPSEAVSGEDQ